MSDRLPLSGIRVIDFGHIVAGPFCARLLADLGADVVKIETSTRQGRTGARRGAPRGGNNGRTPHLYHINRNRRSIDLNLKTERGVAIAKRLVDAADVLVENYSAGVMDRLGLSYEALFASNPRLIYATMASFGQTGPRRGWTGMNVNLQAASGLMLATGAEGDPPIGISNSWNDYIGGLHAAVAILAALSERNKTGKGQRLDVSQFEGSVAMLGSLLFASAVTGKAPARLGSRSTSAAPQGCYRCAGDDQWCAISVQSDEEWQKLRVLVDCKITGATLADRLAAHDAIDAAIEVWTNKLSPAEVERRLTALGIHAAAMRRGNELEGAKEWQQVLHPLREPGAEGKKVIGLPFAFRHRTAVAVTEAPRMGNGGREALRDWLKLEPAAIDELMREETV